MSDDTRSIDLARLCTVSRTVGLGTPVTSTLASAA